MKKNVFPLIIISFVFFMSVPVYAIENNTDRPGLDYKDFDLLAPRPAL
jgi:hypothetical protein